MRLRFVACVRASVPSLGRNTLRPFRVRTPCVEGGASISRCRVDITPHHQVCPKPLMARMPPSADTDDTDCVHAFIRHLPSVYIRDGEAASVASVVQSLVDGLAREVPAPPSARGVRLASGRLTRSGRRHGGTESGSETGLRAVSPTWSPLREGSFLPQNTQKRPSGDTKEALAKPSRLRPRRARPSRKSLNRCCFAKIREGCACRSRGFATNPCRLQAA